MEFELNIKLLLFHTNAGTDEHIRLESPRTRASSEAEVTKNVLDLDEIVQLRILKPKQNGPTLAL